MAARKSSFIACGAAAAAALLFCAPAFAAQAEGSAQLPEDIAAAFKESGVSYAEAGIWVAPAGASDPVLELNARRPMQPGSVIKTVTTLAALDLLGPAYTWKTEFLADAMPDSKGRVTGLVVKGGGDPHFVIERLWLAAQKLSLLGVKTIDGNITIDRSLFDLPAFDEGDFDGQRTRPYNVGADAAMVAFKSVSLSITPVEGEASARVIALPSLAGVAFPSRVPLSSGSCGDWKQKIKPDFSDPLHIRFRGAFPRACGQKTLNLTLWAADDYFTRAFSHVLAQNGIRWKGRAVEGSASAGSRAKNGVNKVELLTETSEPLAVAAYWTNKFSNNPMARHIFLSLSFAEVEDQASGASLERSRRVLSHWASESTGLSQAELQKSFYVENGSGLSRKTRVTPEALGRILSWGFKSAVMPEFMATLPIAGEDGTMRKRGLSAGAGHIKTGLLENVRAAAGYVTDDAGMRWSVVAIVNARPMKAGAQKLTQAVLEWCASGGARRALAQKEAGRKRVPGVFEGRPVGRLQ